MNKLVYTLLLSSCFLIIGSCSKEDPPEPGEKTFYPGTNPDSSITPGFAVITFYVDKSTCFNDVPVYIEITSTLLGLVAKDTVNPAFESWIDCNNTTQLGTRFVLPAGDYTYHAQETSGPNPVIWDNPFSLKSGDCHKYKMFCY